MPARTRPKSPKSTLKVRGLPKVGDEILIRARVTRVGRNRHDTADVLTLRIADHPAPVTATASYLLGEGEPDD